MASTINNKAHWWEATKDLLTRNKRVDGKELQEDFLKYIYEQGKTMTRQQVDEAAKDLHTNREGMAAIVGALVLAGELTANDALTLTEKGCMHALRLIRAHRIMRHQSGTSGRIAWNTASRPTSKSASRRCWATRFSTLMATPYPHLRWPLQIKA